MIHCFVKQGRLTALFILISTLYSHAQDLDISGWKIDQANSTITVTFPSGTTIARGGYLVIARNPASKSAFESFWGVTLAPNVTYLNGTALVAGNGFPVVNGSENYTLKNASSTIIDGPTVSMLSTAGQSIQRKAPGDPAGQDTSWNKLSTPNSTANPGSGAGPSSTAGLVINEFSDASGTGNFIYEFVELYYDVAPPPTGVGSAAIFPTTVRGAVLDTMTLSVKSAGSTTLSYVDVVVPPAWSWSHSTADVATTGGGSPSVSVAGDTIKLTGVAVTTSDSVTIQMFSLTPPDSTNLHTFQVLTGTVADSILPLLGQPSVLVVGAPLPISYVKTNDANGIPLLLRKYVTVRGIVTVGNEFGSPSYMQDNTGGIGFYDPAISSLINPGDEIVLTGTVAPFNGLAELTNLTLQGIATTGNIVDPLVVTASAIRNDGAGGVEQYEGMLVRVNAGTVTDTFGTQISTWAVSGSGTNYRLNDASGNVDLRVDNNVNYANTPAPQSAFDVIGIVGQFKTSSPYIGGYQFMPRKSSDILSKGPMFALSPYESDITPTSFRINWSTIDSGTSRLRYGLTTSYELGVLGPDDGLRKIHAIDVTGLTAATIYHIQAFSVKDPDTSTAGDLVVSTASPVSSTGQMHVYFNKSVVTSLAISQTANGNENLVSRFLTRVNSATYSISAAFYSLSGVSEGNAIATALISAKNRGVVVRIICEANNRNTTAFNSIAAAGIPIITDAYDLVNAGAGLSHNKFAVFDYSGGAPESIWVWSGSWNPTDPGTMDDRQNSIEIQDVALAGAYTTEFNEMWGSSTATPNQSLTRFGARKRDNTPHHFIINGVPVESYFSPSDHTTSHIAATLNKAQHSASVSILTFTRKDLADTLIARKNAGKKVRVVLDNNTDTGNQYAYLQSNGIDIHLKGGGAGLLHHKYAAIDGDQIGGAQYTITGSHNWSNSAEGSNDENTLIIQNDRIANQYLQEFAARYYEAGGTDSIYVAVSPMFSVAPSSINFGTVDTAATKTDSVVVSNAGNASLTISMVTSTNVVFRATPDTAVVAPSAQQKFYIDFHPTSAGLQNGSIIFTHNAPGSPDTVTVQGTGHVDTTITPSDSAKFIYHILSGWNMISVPLKVADARRSALFPTATTPRAFGYSGIYVQKDTMLIGEGYWLKFSGAETDTIAGLKMDVETTRVVRGWNIIGPPSKPVAVASIIQSPPNIVRSNYFGYNGVYFVEDTLEPGKAYWVKTNTSDSGRLFLGGALAIAKVHPANELSEFNILTVTDGGGFSQKLYFGSSSESFSEAFSIQKYEAPPLAPGDGLDVRFSSGGMVELLPKEAEKSADYSISLRSANFPIKIAWAIDSKDNNYYTLRVTDANGNSQVRLSASGEITLRSTPGTPSTIVKLLLTVIPQKALPQEYSLGQNYPNPFNPGTTIPFSLPGASSVTLKIYNILGEVVMTLLENKEFDAGYFESPLDASYLASGVYIFRLNAVGHDAAGTTFHQQRKLLLIK